MSTALAQRRDAPTLGATGVRKAAVLCLTLGKDAAADILRQLTPLEVEELTREIALTASVDPTEVEHVLGEFRGVFQAADAAAQGGLIVAQELLEKAIGPQRAKTILDKIQEQITDTGLKRLRKVAPELLLSVLRGEHPQTIALILAHLDARQSVNVISTMESDLAADVLYRIARMDKIAPEILALVETGLANKTDLSLNQEMTTSAALRPSPRSSI